jgi:cell division protein FtsL
MSVARPERVAGVEQHLRVVKGRRKAVRPALAPWMIMAVVGIAAFLGLVFARTSLDNSAFDLAELTELIEEETTLNRDLKLEIARMENPARLAPLAEEMGLVIPQETHQLLVDLAPASPSVVLADVAGASQ